MEEIKIGEETFSRITVNREFSGMAEKEIEKLKKYNYLPITPRIYAKKFDTDGKIYIGLENISKHSMEKKFSENQLIKMIISVCHSFSILEKHEQTLRPFLPENALFNKNNIL